MPNNLTLKEENFCKFYLNTSSPSLSARLAGLNKPYLLSALRALARSDVRERLDVLVSENKRDGIVTQAAAALLDAVTCDVSDAIKLAAMDDEALLAAADSLNLSCIAKIKRQKGATEIEFVDRVKALSALCDLGDGSASASAAELIEAVTKSSREQAFTGDTLYDS